MHRWTTHPWRLLTLTVLLGLALRGYFIGETLASGGPERFEYHTIAQNFLSGRGCVYEHLGTLYHSYYAGVTYVGLTAALYALWPPGDLAVLLAQAVLSAVLAVVVFFIGRRLWDERAGLLAAALSLLHPALFYYDVKKLHPLGLDSLLISLSIALLLWAQRPQSRAAPLAAGTVLGLAALQRGSLLLFLPVALVWVWWVDGRHPLRRSRMLRLALGSAVVLGSWLARSISIHGVPIFLTTTAEHFWLGNVPQSYGSALLPSGVRVIDTAPESLLADLQSRDELGQYSVFWKAGLSLVREYPGTVLAGILRKFFYFWTFAPQTGALYPAIHRRVYLMYYAVIALAAAAGVVRVCRRGWGEASNGVAGLVLILAMFLSVSTVHSLFYAELRHRWALEPLMLVLAAIGAVSLLDAASRR